MSAKADSSTRTPVVIVGAGPVGLALALGLSRQGVRSVLLERKPTTSRTSKAPGLHVRTREILAHWGVEGRFLEAGSLWESVLLHDVAVGRRPLLSVDLQALHEEVDRPGLLLLEQNQTERLLLEAVLEAGLCDVRFEAEVVGLEQDVAGARVTYREGEADAVVAAEWVVGCDGASSFIRDALGLPFEGATYSLRPMLADVRIEDERDELPNPRVRTGPGPYRFAARLRPGLWRLVNLPSGEPAGEEVPESEVAEEVERLLGPGPFETVWSNRFRIHVRSAPSFVVGRAVLAGDAAHVHSPASGFGMNGGIQDAHNLAWKLAVALEGGDHRRLLESYDTERRAVVVEETSRFTDRITRLFIQSPSLVRALAFLAFRAMLRVGRWRRRYLRRLFMIDLDYPSSPLLREGDRAAGKRLPNVLLRSPAGEPARLYDLLEPAPAILDVADGGPRAGSLPVEQVIRVGGAGWQDPAGVLRGLLDGRDGWILVRPDAYVAWARHEAEGLESAVRDALGQPGS